MWFIDHTHSFSMLMQLRMLKLSVGKQALSGSKTAMPAECCNTKIQWLQSVQSMCMTLLAIVVSILFVRVAVPFG